MASTIAYSYVVDAALILAPPDGEDKTVRERDKDDAVPWTGRRKSSVLTRLKSYASGLQRLENVERVTVYRAIMIAPPDRLARERRTSLAMTWPY
jgi:hypothetical protein